MNNLGAASSIATAIGDRCDAARSRRVVSRCALGRASRVTWTRGWVVLGVGVVHAPASDARRQPRRQRAPVGAVRGTKNALPRTLQRSQEWAGRRAPSANPSSRKTMGR
eukprot:scaffold184572_cov26-Tisochrysis_lutea.AAC.1